MRVIHAFSLAVLPVAFALYQVSSVAQSTIAGFTSGNFQVTKAGAAVYSIPIQVPPGIVGMEPKITLVYNSHAGNGLVGMGWSLQGLPAIERCPRTIVQDGARIQVNYDTNDRYCMNGRIVAVAGVYGASGAEYRTERESFSRLFSWGAQGNGPLWFQAWTKDGTYMEFGSTGNSEFFAQGKTSIRVWAMNRIADRSGNFVDVAYNGDTPNDEYWPMSISYTGNNNAVPALAPFNSVSFVYEAGRSDPIYRSIAGSTSRISLRLKNIQTFTNGKMVKDYRLAYEQGTATGRSRLISVTECSGDGLQCFVPTTITYSDHTTSGSGSWTGGQTQASAGWRLVDLFGDGRQVYYTHDGAGTHYATRVNPDGTVQNWTWTGGSSTGACGCWDFADLFGTGRQIFHTHSNSGTHYATKFNPDGTLQNWTWIGGQPLGNTGVYRLVDLFGDGRKVYYTYSTGGTHLATRLSSDGTLTNWTWTGAGPADANWNVGDLFGDGRLVVYWYSGNTHGATRLSSDNTLQTWSWTDTTFSVSTSGFRLVDLFGDGRDLFYTNWGNGTHSATRLNTDGSFQKITWTGTALPGDAGWDMGDVKGEGRQHYTTHTSAGSHTAIRFNADGTYNTWTWTDTVGTVAGSWKLGDVFGTGRSVFYTNASGTHKASSAAPLALSAVPADLATKITNGTGLGSSISIGYDSLIDAAVYAKGTTAAYPYMDLQTPLYVVQSSTISDGAGGSAQTNYAYAGALVHLSGGGFLGFNGFNATNVITGVTVKNTLRQDYPFQGLATSLVTTKPGGAILTQVSNTWTDTSYVNTTGNYHRSDLTKSVQSGNDLDASILPTVTTTTTYDTYGSPLTVTTSTGDGYSKTTTNTYLNIVDPANWQLGRLTSSSIASTIPGPSTQTRTSGFEYNSIGLLIREAIEPGDSNLCLVTTYAYDVFGNGTSATTRNCNGTSSGGLTEAAAPIGDAVFTSRTSSTQYQAGSVTIGGVIYNYPAGQFATTATNALNQSETRSFDPRFGAMLSVTVPNNLTTNWSDNAFGRKTMESRADGTSTTWTYSLCGIAPNYCGFSVAAVSTGAPNSTTYYDSLNRVNRTEVQGFDGTLVRKDTQYDSLSHVTAASQPYFSTATPVWTTLSYDILGRVTSETSPTGAVTQRGYSGLTSFVINALFQVSKQTKNSQGQITRVVTCAYPC